jgi:exopolysaccharide biosynthesis predicted pyruvyltransferase EpsI
MQENSNVIDKQIQKLQQILGSFVNYGDEYALIDFPDHSNVGDSAIWLGEVVLLKQLTGNAPKYVSDLHNFDAAELARRLPQGVIFIHGGGNFGDIWPQHQLFREYIVSNFPNRKVVQLPQSIKFSDQDNINKAAAVFDAHPDFHLLVRDKKSDEFAQLNFKANVILSPDCAFGLGPQPRHKSLKKYLYLLRTDTEKNQNHSWSDLVESNDAIACDWLDDGRFFKFRSRLLAIILMAKSIFNGNTRFHYYQSKATIRVNRGLKTLSKGEVVVTDRLHAHILSTLLNIPNYVLDNNYGKISGYIECWTKDFPLVSVFKSTEELKEKIKTNH